MADCDWLILCDYSFRDEGKKICLIGAFDRIFAHAVPAMHANMALSFKLVGEPNEVVPFRAQLVRPTGAELAQMGGEARLSDIGTTEINLNIANVQLPDFGAYAFNLYIQEQLAKTALFTVSKPPEKQH